MPRPADRERVAVLWTLSWTDESVLACNVYRGPRGLQLCIESNATTVLSEPFALEPRAVARAHALRDSLKRRGWVER